VTGILVKGVFFLLDCEAYTIPLPAVTGPIAVTAGSSPFNAAAHQTKPIDLKRAGYREEEYFLSGKVAVYNWDRPGPATVRTPAAPYTNRILVRKPAEPERFSGNVFVEIVNSTSTYDCSVLWYACHEKLLRDGDVYVGVTSKPISVKSLQRYDPVRYQPLAWPNPLPPAQRGNNPGDYMPPGVPGSFADSEDGLIWDIISQTGALLRSGGAGNPLNGYRVENVYAMGASQSALVLTTYINAIHPLAKLARQQPVFDGYLLTVGAYPLQINQDGPVLFPPGDPRTIIRCDVPVIQFLSESDFRSMGPWPFLATRREDSDLPDDKFRLYEIPGACHTNLYTIDFRSGKEELAGLGYAPPDLSGIIANDFPTYCFYIGALLNLDRWARGGTPPPMAPRIELDRGSETDAYGNAVPPVKRDRFGNAAGGLRTPFLDVPVAVYTASTPANPLMGELLPFTRQQLTALYGSHQRYLELFQEQVNELLRQRWIDPAEEKVMIDYALQQRRAFA
jgi:hypothetical protein